MIKGGSKIPSNLRVLSLCLSCSLVLQKKPSCSSQGRRKAYFRGAEAPLKCSSAPPNYLALLAFKKNIDVFKLNYCFSHGQVIYNSNMLLICVRSGLYVYSPFKLYSNSLSSYFTIQTPGTSTVSRQRQPVL